MINLKQIIPFKQELLFKTKICEITSISLEHTLSLKEDDLISGEFLITGDYKMTQGSINREKFSFHLPFEITLDSRYDVANLVIDIDNFYYEVVNNEYLKVNIDVYIEGNKLEEKKEEAIMDAKVEEEKDSFSEEKKEKPSLKAEEQKEEERSEREDKDPQDSEIEEVSILGEHNKNEIEKNIDYANLEKELELIDNNITNIENDTQNVNIQNTSLINDHKEEFSSTKNIKENYIEPNISNTISSSISQNQAETTHMDMKDNQSIHNELNLFENIDNSDTYVTYHVYIVKENDNIDTIADKYGVSKEEITNYNDITNISPGDKLIIPNANE